ncbi:discoidin domain-containing protein, partial [Paenibacillus sp. MCAF20]
SGPDSIDIQWTIVNGASYYAIYRKEGVNGTYTKVNETTSTRLTDSNLPIGTYYYKVSAGSNAGESPLSGEASVTTLASVSVKASMVKANTNLWPGTGTPEGNGWLAFDGNTATSPDAITNPAWILIDFGAGHAKTIRGLKFYPRSTNVSRMNGAVIQGSDDGATFVDLYTINGITETKWQFVSFENNHAYRYMRYYTPNGNANVAELQFYKDAMENSAPIIADLSPLTIHSGETVAQTISAHDEDGDAISLEAADLPDGAQWHASTGEFSWTPETAGTYTLHFKATDARGAESTKSWLITVIEGTLPAPDNLTASLSAPNSVDLQWTAVQGASYYAIYRKAGTTGAFTKVSETTATKWTDSNLQPETYFYRVSAGGYAGESSQSEAAAVETLALLTIDATMVKANTNLWPGTGTPEENGWLAFDGKTATSPDAITNPAWILIDLGAGNEQIVGGVMFYPRSANVNRMNGAVVQGSDDGVTFVDLYTINGITAAKWHFVPINNNEAYRYLRYYTPKGNANVAELQFYNKANELPNNAPLIAELSPVSIHLGETVTQTITATDEDGDFVSLEGVNLPEGAEWDAATGVFSWTPETQGTY